MASPILWTWTSANSGRWWGIGKPGLLQSMGSRRIRRDLVTEQQYSIVYMYYSFFIRSSVNEHLGCFHVLAIVNSASVNTVVHVSFSSAMVSSGYLPSSEIVEPYGSFIPSYWRNLHTVFCNGCYQFTFPPTVWEGSLFSKPFSAFMFVDFLIMAILTGMHSHHFHST